MKLSPVSPAKSLNKAYLRQSLKREQIELFKANLARLFDRIRAGNPPYIRQEAIKEQKPAFMEMFGSFYCGTADIYTYFYKTGLNLLKTGATLCYIAPNKFMRAGYGKNTRELLTTQAKPLMVLDFGDLPVFDEATTYPSIVMVEKVPPPTPSSTRRGGTSAPATAPSLIRRGLGVVALSTTGPK